MPVARRTRWTWALLATAVGATAIAAAALASDGALRPLRAFGVLMLVGVAVALLAAACDWALNRRGGAPPPSEWVGRWDAY